MMGYVSKRQTQFYIAFNCIFLWFFFSYFRIYADSADMAENYAWGMVWDLGNNKHPPLFSWITAIWFKLFPTRDWAYFLLSQINLAVTLLILRKALLEFLDENKTFIAIVLTSTTLSLGLRNGWEYNANLAQLPFLAGYTWAFIKHHKSSTHYRYLLIASCLAAAATLCKYSAILMLLGITLTLWHFFRPRMRAIGRDLIILSLVTGVAITPHIVWEFLHDFPALHYMHTRHAAQASLASAISSFKELIYALNFGIISVAMIGLATAKQLGRTNINGPKTDFINKKTIGLKLFIWCCGLIIFASVLQSLQADLGWFVVPTMFFGWALTDLLGQNIDIVKVKRNISFLLIIYFCLTIASGLKHKDKILNHGMPIESIHEILAQDITRIYHEKYHHPIEYIGGSFPLPYQISFYSSDHPYGIAGLDLKNSTWIDPSSFQHKHKVVVCGSLKREFPIEPNCSNTALQQFGSPDESFQLKYKLYDSTIRHVENTIFNVYFY